MAMNLTSSSSSLLRSISIFRFVALLKENGWRIISHPNEKIIVFEGIKDDEGQPLNLILPRTLAFQDSELRLQEAIALCSAVSGIPESEIVQRVVTEGTTPKSYATPRDSSSQADIHGLKLKVAEAINAQQFIHAERLTITTLLKLQPGSADAEDMRRLLEEVYFHRHLDLGGVELSEDELQFSVSGNEVKGGVAPSDKFMSRIRYAEKLIERTAERSMGKVYRTSSNVPKHVKDDYRFFLSVPRERSFAVTLKIGQSKDQASFFPNGVAEVLNSFLTCIDLFNESKSDALKDEIPDPAYYNHFVSWAKQVLPDGKDISQVGLTAIINGTEKRVSLTNSRDEVTVAPMQVTTLTGQEEKSEPLLLQGRLIYADSTKSELKTIRIKIDNKKTHKGIIVPVGMDEIVREMWETVVIAKCSKTSRGLVLNDIQRVSDQ